MQNCLDHYRKHTKLVMFVVFHKSLLFMFERLIGQHTTEPENLFQFNFLGNKVLTLFPLNGTTFSLRWDFSNITLKTRKCAPLINLPLCVV